MNIQSLGRSIDTTSCHIASVPERRPVAGDSSATVTNEGVYAIGRTATIRTSHAIQTIIAGSFEAKILTHKYDNNDQGKIGKGMNTLRGRTKGTKQENNIQIAIIVGR